jgi:hypothetical protein
MNPDNPTPKDILGAVLANNESMTLIRERVARLETKMNVVVGAVLFVAVAFAGAIAMSVLRYFGI